MTNSLSAAMQHIDNYILNLKLFVNENTGLAAGTSALSLLMHFISETYEVDVILLALLFFLITSNTASGAYLAKKKGVYDFKILKNGVLNKLLGYFILIVSLLIIICALFIAGIKDDQQLIPVYYLNIFMVLLLVSLCLVEFKSVLDNLEQAGIKIPFFIRKKVEEIENKINE